MQTDSLPAITQPVVSLTLFTLLAMSCPVAAFAQLPTRQQRLPPVPPSKRLGQLETAPRLGEVIVFNPKTLGVSVVGEVESPGRSLVALNTTLNQALLNVAGFKDYRSNSYCFRY
jgi:hypothetical protein